MKKNTANLLMITSIASLLFGCTSIQNLHNKLADMELQKKTLANGQPVYIDFNLTPTSDWGCTQVATPQAYNWAVLQTQSQFHFETGHKLLMDKAITYVNDQNLNVNYINLQIPEENSLSFGSGNSSSSANLDPLAKAYIYYYQCKKINPQHALGVLRQNDISITSGK